MKRTAWGNPLAFFGILVFLTGTVYAGKFSDDRSRLKIRENEDELVGRGVRIKRVIKKKMSPGMNKAEMGREYNRYVDRKREELISNLLEMISRRGQQSEMFELKLRLAEQYIEKARDISFVEQEKYNREYDEFLKRGAKGREPRLSEKRSKRIFKNAVKHYLDLERGYRTHRQRDDVLYFLGYAFERLGKREKAIRRYKEIERRYPHSKYYDEASVSLGEYYFDKGNMRRAIRYYKNVLGFKRSRHYGYALYRMGWCYFNLRNLSRSIKMFQRAILHADRASTKGSIQLKDEALSDLVIVYSEANRMEEAKRFFSRWGGKKYINKVLARSVEVAWDRGERMSAIRMSLQILNDPEGENAGEVMLALIEKMHQAKKFKSEIEMLVKLVKKYAHSDDWRSKVEKVVRIRAKFFHKVAREKKRKRYYNWAARLYAMYLKNFSGNKKTKEMTFYYADVLYDMNRHKSAAKNFQKVARMGSYNMMSREAAYNAIVSFTTVLGINKERKSRIVRKGVRSFREKVIPRTHQMLMNSCKEFAQRNPRDSRTPSILFLLAYEYYMFYHFDNALKGFKKIVAGYPSSKVSDDAAHLILDIHNIRKDYVALNADAQDFMKNRKLGNRTFKKEVTGLVAGSAFKMIGQLERRKKYELAARSYEKFARKYAGLSRNMAAKATYNAAINYQKAGNTEGMLRNFNLLQRKYASAGLVKNFELLLGQLFEGTMNFPLSANYYYRFAKRSPRHKNARDALYNAGLYYHSLGMSSKAIRSFSLYLKNYSRSRDIPKVYLMMGDAYSEDGNYRKAVSSYRKVTKHRRARAREKIQALGKIAGIYEKQGKRGQLRQLHRQIIAAYRSYPGRIRNQETLDAVASAFFHKHDRDYNRFRKITLRLPKKRLARNMKRKLGLLAGLRKKYVRIISIGSAKWALESLYRMADMYSNLSQSIYKIPLPSRIKGKRRKIFRKKLNQKAAPSARQAAEYYKSCMEKAMELKYYSDVVNKCVEGYGRYGKKKVATAVEILPRAGFAVSETYF